MNYYFYLNIFSGSIQAKKLTFNKERILMFVFLSFTFSTFFFQDFLLVFLVIFHYAFIRGKSPIKRTKRLVL